MAFIHIYFIGHIGSEGGDEEEEEEADSGAGAGAGAGAGSAIDEKTCKGLEAIGFRTTHKEWMKKNC